MSKKENRRLIVLGIRGIPARHGGFETFAEKLSCYLAHKEWDVTVYCQVDKVEENVDKVWNGINLVHIPVKLQGAKGTIIFDLKAALAARRQNGIVLTLGYNTALFNLTQRLCGQKNIINMDGLEWNRTKWNWLEKKWLKFNEWLACRIANHLLADHPEIENHLLSIARKEKISMIPYGADQIMEASADFLLPFGVEPREFSVLIARPEPENSILEIVRAFSARSRGHRLIVLGNFSPGTNRYHREVLGAASCEVIFPGAIYEADAVKALRFYCRYYVHGHQVGGTNPSLVEAMGAHCAILAHDNKFNRWVAGEGAIFFRDEIECRKLFDRHLGDEKLVKTLEEKSYARFLERFEWSRILQDYEALLLRWT